jgi:hypothetical protein
MNLSTTLSSLVIESEEILKIAQLEMKHLRDSSIRSQWIEFRQRYERWYRTCINLMEASQFSGIEDFKNLYSNDHPDSPSIKTALLLGFSVQNYIGFCDRVENQVAILQSLKSTLNNSRNKGKINHIPSSRFVDVSRRRWDFFICHASEDKAEVVEPLAVELASRGAVVWYDRWTLKIGDSLSAKIDEGLASSRYGIVVLSPHFFTKPWPQRELSGLVQREMEGRKVILPVWHNVDHAFVARHSPTLADKMAGSTSIGIAALAVKLLETTGKLLKSEDLSQSTVSLHNSATLNIGYQKVKITSTLHRYSLTATLTLLVPPDQGKLRLQILWPQEVRIVHLSNIREEASWRRSGADYRKLVLDWEHRVFPGETVDILGPETAHQIEYEYDNEIYWFLTENPREILYTLYFEDHAPITGEKPFQDLNVY